jgi:hypothetical protein
LPVLMRPGGTVPSASVDRTDALEKAIELLRRPPTD